MTTTTAQQETQVPAQQQPPALRQMIRNHAATGDPAVAQEALRQLSTLLHVVPFGDDWPQLFARLEDCAKTYMRSTVAQKYPYLSPDLFKLTRDIAVPKEKVTHRDDYQAPPTFHFTIPALAYVQYGAPTWPYKAEIKRENGNQSYDISAPAPKGIPASIRTAARDAMAFALNTCANLLQEKTFNEYLRVNTGERLRQLVAAGSPVAGSSIAPEDLIHGVKPRLGVLWKPALDELVVEQRSLPERDPALILEFAKDRYLVEMWDMPGELSIHHYLKEYAVMPRLGRRSQTPGRTAERQGDLFPGM